MLQWTRTDGTWFGNGYRIERHSRQTWILIDNTAPRDAVTADTEIATLHTLKAAQNVAEWHHGTLLLAETRKRLLAVALGMGALTLILTGAPLAAMATAVIGASALLELIATFFDRSWPSAREVIQ